MPKPRKVADPEKELRFTRGRYARTLGLIGACSTIGLVLLAYAIIRVDLRDGELPPHLSYYFLLPLALSALLSSYLALRCVRHAYLLLTPLGIEILPLLPRPSKMRMAFWPEIDSCQFGISTLTLHLNGAELSSIKVSTLPLTSTQSGLLRQAIERTLDKRNQPEPKSNS